MTLLGWRGRAWQLPRTEWEREEEYEERVATAYFAEQIQENLEWWDRMGGPTDVRGARALDLGCGHGALSVDLARRGAERVDGLDLDAPRITFARRNMAQLYPDLIGRVAFHAADVCAFGDEGDYDLIVSKDTVEHIDRPERVFRTFARLLRPGGRLMLGFSPLFHSPFGDHMRIGFPLPWLHAVVPEAWSVGWHNLIGNQPPARSISELGLNRLTPAGFRTLIDQPWWQVERIRVNAGRKPLLKLLDTLRHVPALEKYCTVGIYAMLRRTGVPVGE
jgi:SAM-dependent methyltransferase